MFFSTIVSTFTNNILPIILLGSAGFALGKIMHVDPRSLGRGVFYIFSPVLIFDLMINARMTAYNVGTLNKPSMADLKFMCPSDAINTPSE